MNLKSVSNSDLLTNTKLLVSNEKKIGIEVLRHLREIDSRKAFAEIGYSSLFDYCIRELQYAEGSAWRRIQAMRLLREIPEYEEKLKDGLVNVATLSKVHTFFSQEKKQEGKKYSKDEKMEVLKKIEGKSSRQTDQVLAAESPKLAKPETKRPINETQTEIRFTADKELLEKLEKLSNLLGHKLGSKKYAELFEELSNIALKKLSPPPGAVEGKKVSETRYIPVKVRRVVWHRDNGKCTHVDLQGKRCESKHALQYEHIIPFAKGGKTSAENLKLLCPAHNQLSAIHAYGLKKMQKYWGSTK
jgi:hypothetical protein